MKAAPDRGERSRARRIRRDSEVNDTSTPVEGEVIMIERAVSTDLLPPSKDEKLSALSRLTPEQQVEHVTEMLVQSHAGLLVAIAAQDLPGIAEAKAKASTIAEIAKQLRMGKEMQLNAAEFCRRAERGLGVAIREGQERGEILRKGQSNTFGNAHTTSQPLPVSSRPGPTDFATPSELGGANRPGEGIYAMTDGVSDDQFEEALTEAKDEGNLSRANVARKAKAKAEDSRPMPEITEADRAAFDEFASQNTSPYSVTVLTRIAKAALGTEKPSHVRRAARRLYLELGGGKVTISAAHKQIQAADADVDEPDIDATVQPDPGAPRQRNLKKSDIEMLAEITGSLANYAELIQLVRPSQIETEDAQRLVAQARTAWRAINKHLKEIEK